jgi:hypothetical protein
VLPQSLRCDLLGALGQSTLATWAGKKSILDKEGFDLLNRDGAEGWIDGEECHLQSNSVNKDGGQETVRAGVLVGRTVFLLRMAVQRDSAYWRGPP